MRAAALLFVAIMSASAFPLKIDHVTIAGSNLERMRLAFTKATGLPTEYGGRHSNGATEMALTSFPDGSYLELIALQPNPDPHAAAAQPWSAFLKGDAGPCAFAIRAGGAEPLSNLKSAGVSLQSPEHGGRSRPDGTRIEWETTQIGTAPRGTFFPFIIRDLTPRPKRVYLTGIPTTNKVDGVRMVVIGVKDLNEAIDRYRRAFGLAQPQLQRDPEFAAEIAWFEGTPVALAQGLTAGSWITRRVNKYGDAPCAFVLAAHRPLIGRTSPQWFGKTIVWVDEHVLGWRLGMEPEPRKP